jgi:hypothetical protein
VVEGEMHTKNCRWRDFSGLTVQVHIRVEEGMI